MKIRKIATTLMAVFFSLTAFSRPLSAEMPSPESCKAAILTELSTGTVLYELNPDLRLPIASVTKIMTLLITAEEIEKGNISFSDIAVCSAYAGSMDGSVIWLEEGEEMELGELIKSVVIASANDACVVIAEHIEGSEEKFVERMNKKARSLGLTNTHFVNCVGYDDPEHYSSARDIALMSGELKRYDYFDDFLLTRLDSVRTGTKRETQLLNTNKLIRSYDGMSGLKTGTTDNAGCCLSATAEKRGMELCAVVLGCPDDDTRFSTAKSLLDYGFEGFESVMPHPDVSELLEIPVKRGVKKAADTRFSAVSEVILPKGSESKIEYHYSRTPEISAPVEKGQVLGFVTMTVDDEVIGTAKIIAAEEVEELNYGKSLSSLLEEMFRF